MQLRDNISGQLAGLRSVMGMESGLEVAFHTVDCQLKQLILMADQELDDLPVAVQLDFANGYNNASRAAMIPNVERWFPSLTRYTRLIKAGNNSVLRSPN